MKDGVGDDVDDGVNDDVGDGVEDGVDGRMRDGVYDGFDNDEREMADVYVKSDVWMQCDSEIG